MNNIIVYHNNRCGKSRKAVEILEEQGLPFEIRYYLQDPLSEAELKQLLGKLKLTAVDIVRKNEPLYKEQFKDRTLTNEEWLQLLIEYPILTERPIVVNGDKAIVARPPELLLELL